MKYSFTIYIYNLHSQFNICSLLWLFRSCLLNQKIKRLHKRLYTAIFKDFLAKAKTVLIHQRNLRVPASEMYKIAHGLSSDLKLWWLIKANNPPLDRNVLLQLSNFGLPKVKTVWNSLTSFGPRLWNLIIDEGNQIFECFQREDKEFWI